MKALICGLGAIGQRHVRFLRDATDQQIEIAVFRQRKLNQVIATDLQSCQEIDPVRYLGVKSFDDYDSALAWKPDMVFVTNPIAMHMQIALPAANAGCHLFIEKPVSDEKELALRLLQTVKSGRLVCMVGYQTRFHPAYEKIREYLMYKRIGEIKSAELCYAEWLPGMHPYTDYRTSHEAQREQGGGVILCLSHDIDVASWLFGKPNSVFASGGKTSDLEMDVEDNVDLLLEYGDGVKRFDVSIHLDFIRKPKQRFIRIEGTSGRVNYDHASGILEMEGELDGNAISECEDYSQLERNTLFKAEIDSFLKAISDKSQARVSLEEGLASLDICLAAKQSLSSQKVVSL